MISRIGEPDEANPNLVTGSDILADLPAAAHRLIQKEGCLALTESVVTTSQPIAVAEASMPVPKSQPLWRFALVGLGPLEALALFALGRAIFQHMG